MDYPIPPLLSFLITLAWFVVITNAFNLVDGLDGLAGGLTGLAALGLAGSLILRGIYVEAVILLGLIGAILGFLRFNISPARIFLGDCGSNLCGFTLAYMMLSTGSKHLAFAQEWVVFLIMIVPLADTALAIWRRSVSYLLSRSTGSIQKGGVMTGDLEHIHHRLQRLGLTNRDVVAVLYLTNAIFILLSLISLPIPHYAISLVGMATLILTLCVLLFIPPREIRQSALLVYVLIIKPRSPMLGRTIRLLIDALITAAALVGAFLLCHPECSLTTLAWFWIEVAPYWLLSALAVSVYVRRDTDRNGNHPPILKALLAPLALALLGLNISLILPVKSWQALTMELSMFGILTVLLLSTKLLILNGVKKFVESPTFQTSRR